jgi:Ca2+:H+ antiporter
MKYVLNHIKTNPLSVLLIFLPLALVGELVHWPPMWMFFLAAIGVIPMAGYIGSATETLAEYTGPKIGGLLNATLGNAAELIITLVAIRAGLLDLVKASITGSILGNLLLVMGFAFVLGGVKNGSQFFDRKQAGNHAVLLTLAVLALVIPSIFSHSIGPDESLAVEGLSLGVAAIMIILYSLGLIYSLSLRKSSAQPLGYQVENTPVHKKPSDNSWVKALVQLALATIGVVWLSELLVGSVEPIVEDLGLSEFFLGIILIPIVGNVAEHLVAVQMALKNKMDLSVEIAISSSLQVALFVAPLLVFISLVMGNPLNLIFNQFELLAVGAAVLVTGMVCADGESNWLEGAALVSVYLILSIAFFLLPV